MLFGISAFLISALVLTGNYFYVIAQKDGPTKKSMLLKMLCATGYILMAVLCIVHTDEFSDFDRAMILALSLSWVGDLFLHINKSKVCMVIGFLGFLFSHVCFIRAYLKGIKIFSPELPFFSLPLIIILIAGAVLFTVMVYKTNMQMLRGPLLIPVLLYTCTILTMFLKAFRLGFLAYEAGAGIFTVIAAAFGALCFVASDFTISILMFNKGQKKNLKLKFFNMYTYFIAQLLLASLTAFI